MVQALGMALGANDPQKWGGKPPLACCPDCGEPLIGTMLFPFKEFVCIECGALWGFVEPVPKKDEPPLSERAWELQRDWRLASIHSVEQACTWIEQRSPGAHKKIIANQ